MKLDKLKEKLIGKELKTIITLDNCSDEIKSVVTKITGYYGNDIDELQLLVFDDFIELLFVDYDCDGYRSGNWYLSILHNVLDKGCTKEIKHINSVIRDIVYFDSDDEDKEFFMFTTDEYIITMGQNHVSDYYPQNFFSVEECKKKAIIDRKDVDKNNSGEIIEP